MGKSIVQNETPRNHAGFATARFAATRIFLEDHAFGGHACSARGILIGQQRVQSKIQAGNIVQQVIVPLLNQPQGT